MSKAYAAAGLDLAADLDRLAAAPRVAPDPRAVARVARTSLPVGLTPWPVLTGHCRFSAAEEVVAFRVLFERIETGRWPAADVAAMNAEATALGPARQLVHNPLTGAEAAVAPAFAPFEVGPSPRPLPSSPVSGTQSNNR